MSVAHGQGCDGVQNMRMLAIIQGMVAPPAMWQACPYRVAAAVHALSTEMLASEFCVLFDFQTALALGCQGLKGHMSNS